MRQPARPASVDRHGHRDEVDIPRPIAQAVASSSSVLRLVCVCVCMRERERGETLLGNKVTVTVQRRSWRGPVTGVASPYVGA